MGKYSFSKAERWGVYQAHGGICAWCVEPIDFRFIEVDHLIPETATEKELQLYRADYDLPDDFDVNSYENWLPACGPCNKQKGAAKFQGGLMLRLLTLARRKAADARSAERGIIRSAKSSRILIVLETALASGAVESADVRELLNATSSIGAPPDKTTLVIGDVTATYAAAEKQWEILKKHTEDVVTLRIHGKIGVSNLNPDAHANVLSAVSACGKARAVRYVALSRTTKVRLVSAGWGIDSTAQRSVFGRPSREGGSAAALSSTRPTARVCQTQLEYRATYSIAPASTFPSPSQRVQGRLSLVPEPSQAGHSWIS